MFTSHQQVDWQVLSHNLHDVDTETPISQQIPDIPSDSFNRKEPNNTFLSTHRVESLMALLSLVFFMAFYAMWMQVEQKISTVEKGVVNVENDLSVVRKEISELDSKSVATPLQARSGIATKYQNHLDLIDHVIESEDIKPQWRIMALGLATYIQMENGNKINWQFDAIHLPNRRLAQTRSVELAYDSGLGNEYQYQEQFSTSINPHDVADPLSEFIIETYSFDVVSDLLEGFTQYENWETLVPNVFGISVSEFEAQWHTYMRMRYSR